LAGLETFLGRVPAKIKRMIRIFLLIFYLKKIGTLFVIKKRHLPPNFLEKPNLFSERKTFTKSEVKGI
jgi:hypothetical protein